jgi:uncharacterized protein (DUF2252 family)
MATQPNFPCYESVGQTHHRVESCRSRQGRHRCRHRIPNDITLTTSNSHNNTQNSSGYCDVPQNSSGKPEPTSVGIPRKCSQCPAVPDVLLRVGSAAVTPANNSGTSAPAATVNSTADVLTQDLTVAQESVLEQIAKAGAQKPVPHPSVAEREQTGRAARATTPRGKLAAWSPGPDRVDAVSLLLSQETSRVQELVPVRHARMATSAFAFYRGAALVMAADLAPGPRSGLDAQLCGDAHLSNFGLFAAPDRSVIFDVNDFDETNPGPFEWDVKRLATSFILAGRDNKLPDAIGQVAAESACTAYRNSMASYATSREIDIWYDRVDAAGVLESFQQRSPKALTAKAARKAQAILDKSVAKARSRDAWSVIEKITEVVDGQRQFLNQPPLLTRLALDDDTRALVNRIFREYRSTLQEDRQELLKRYEIIDMGHKVVGVGSVGLLAFVLLMRGRDDNDLMVLQVKQAQQSVLEAFTHKSGYTKHGHRVVAGQRLMQAASDSFLGWIDGPGGRSFYVRQLRDMKWSPDPSNLNAERLQRFALICGHTLARAHARSGDAIAISAYLGTSRAFDKAIAAFAVAYADQMESDYAEFTQAIADGHIDAGENANVTAVDMAKAVRTPPIATKATAHDPS